MKPSSKRFAPTNRLGNTANAQRVPITHAPNRVSGEDAGEKVLEVTAEILWS